MTAGSQDLHKSMTRTMAGPASTWERAVVLSRCCVILQAQPNPVFCRDANDGATEGTRMRRGLHMPSAASHVEKHKDNLLPYTCGMHVTGLSR